jgi:LPPG:FO 2-phospho-L-lactate transferase
MTTFLAGGTGTPKLLAGAQAVFPPAETTVIGNTGDDVFVGGHLICPDLDTVLFLDAEMLERTRWWGIAGDTDETHRELLRIAEETGLGMGPRYLDERRQTEGHPLAAWRRFSAVGEFMLVGDRDRALHLTRTSLLDEGYTLTEVFDRLRDAYDVERTLLPMSDDPVASLVHVADGPGRQPLQHFQEWWVGHRAEPPVERVEFRGSETAEPTEAVLTALTDPVVIGPSNPVTSIGPMMAMDTFEAALHETPVVAVSPFVGDELYSGPAAELMAAMGYDPSTGGLANAYPFVDAFVLDGDDDTDLDRPVVRTDTPLDEDEDAARVARAVREALEVLGA